MFVNSTFKKKMPNVYKANTIEIAVNIRYYLFFLILLFGDLRPVKYVTRINSKRL